MRRHPNLSQADIARATGVKTPSVADWINGKTKSLKPEPARLGAELFRCDQNWLATGTGTPKWLEVGSPTPTTAAPASAQQERPDLAAALPVVLEALAAASQRDKLRTALMALLEDDSPAYRQRLAELLGLP